MLAGDQGAARQAAMRVIVHLAAAQGATELIDVEQAHIDGCFYTGPGGLRFAEMLAEMGGHVKVPSTTNAASVDAKRWRVQGIDPAAAEGALRVGDAYVRMGVRPTFTCAPYLLESAPAAGERIAWGESNAVAFANSVLGARTMKYPDFGDICAALTGRAPAAEEYFDDGRLATVHVAVEDLGPIDDSFYPLLGYHVGAIAGYEIPVVSGLESIAPTVDDLKAFSAAFATSAAASMFHIVGVTPEAPTLERALRHDHPARKAVVTRTDLLQTWHELDSADDASVDLVSLGNPHFSLTDIATTVDLCRGRSIDPSVTMIITCGRDIYAAAERAGHIAALEAFGAQVLNDTCWCQIEEPVLPVTTSTLITNSAKYAHYGPGTTGRRFRFAGLAACIDAACTGRAPDGPPRWLQSGGVEA
jgi:predicted aconitase